MYVCLFIIFIFSDPLYADPGARLKYKTRTRHMLWRF
jgi:hypothetical protein